MKLTGLFDCDFRGGRAASAPQTRASASTRTTMAEAYTVGAGSEGEHQDPLMPHRVLDREELDRQYPSIEVHEEENLKDYGDAQDDPMVAAGSKVIEEIQRKAEDHGRRRIQK